MKNVVIIGAGTAGLAAGQALRGKANIAILEKKGGFGELANSSPCTFRDVVSTLSRRFDMHATLREAIRTNAYDFGNEEKYPHFKRTDEGPERLARILSATSAAVPAVHSEWLFDAIVQNPLRYFSFIADGAERKFATTLVKIDPVVLHRILATGIEGSIRFGKNIIKVDEARKNVHTEDGEAFDYDVLIDASGSAMATSPHFIPLELHNCYEHNVEVDDPFPQEFVERAAFRVDLDPNANPKDPTNTSCVWIYPIDRRHVIIGPDDYIGFLILQNPDVTRDDIIRILRERLIMDMNNDPAMKGLFNSYRILESRFNTIPQSGIGMRVCARGVLRIGDAGLDATPASAEGIRRGIELAGVAGRAITISRDDESLARNYLRMRDELKARDWPFVFARWLMFNGYNDVAWREQLKRCGKLDDKTMERLLRNNAGILELLPALPATTIVREFVGRVRRGELFKEVYDGRAMRR